jgi:DNA repair protein RadA/Sms
VLGGGLVPASLVLVGGEPGVGKSTLAARRRLASISAATGARYS